MSDDLKFALGPLLALVPVLVWELLIKPARVRRNLALSLVTEIELNLAWISRMVAKRTKDKTGIPAAPKSETLVVTSNTRELAELPQSVRVDVMIFYSNLDDVVRTIETLHRRDTERHVASTLERTLYLTDSLKRGHASLDSVLPGLVRLGADLRERLHGCAEAASMSELPRLAPFQKLVDSAVRSDVARQVAEGKRPGAG